MAGENHGIGKTGDRHQRTGSGMPGDIIEYMAKGENRGEKNQRHRGHAPGLG